MQWLTIHAVVPWITMLFLIGFGMFTSWLPVQGMSLHEWQAKRLGWNYVSAFSHYIAIIAILLTFQFRFTELGLKWGKWSTLPIGIFYFTLLLFGSVIVLSNYQATKRLVIRFPGWSTLFFQGIYVPIGEELFWRGYLQPEVGLWLSAAAFGLIHALEQQPVRTRLAAALYAGILGLIFGLLRMMTGGIVAGVILHGVLNVTNHVTSTAMSSHAWVSPEPSRSSNTERHDENA